MGKQSSVSEEESYLELVRKLMREVKYGSLTLIIQDGKVIQVDKVEKHRL